MLRGARRAAASSKTLFEEMARRLPEMARMRKVSDLRGRE
jgi:hypothetical protein